MPQRAVRHLRAAESRRLPWKNGRGMTEELFLSPPEGNFSRGEFDWRISKARIEEPGPFSEFSGFDRALVVTHGEGIWLEHGKSAPRARVRPMEPYCFSGDWKSVCELVQGPVADFNVLVRRARHACEVTAVRLGNRRLRESVERGAVFVHALDGPLVARLSGEEQPFELAEGDSLFAEGLARGDEVDLVGSSTASAVLLVRLTPPA